MDRIMLPDRLTAENGAKGLLIGEFSEPYEIACPACGFFPDDECDVCDGSGSITVDVSVRWTTIKRIWAMAADYFKSMEEQQA